MSHKQKVRLARQMLTREEVRKGTPIFQSKAWLARKDARWRREQKKRNEK